MSLKKKINLAEGEQMIEVMHSTPLFHFWHFIAGFCVLLSGAFFTFWLLSYGVVGSVILTAAGFIGTIIVFCAWSSSKKNFWVITNRRLVDIEKHGLLDETISATALADIKDIYVHKKGFGARFFDYGEISVEVYNDAFALTLYGVRHPQYFADRIKSMTRNIIRKKQTAAYQTAINNFLRIMPALELRELTEIKNRLDNQIENMSGQMENDNNGD